MIENTSINIKKNGSKSIYSKERKPKGILILLGIYFPNLTKFKLQQNHQSNLYSKYLINNDKNHVIGE